MNTAPVHHVPMVPVRNDGEGDFHMFLLLTPELLTRLREGSAGELGVIARESCETLLEFCAAAVKDGRDVRMILSTDSADRIFASYRPCGDAHE